MKTLILILILASLSLTTAAETISETEERAQTIKVDGWTFIVDGILTVEEIEIVCLRYKYTGSFEETYKEINNFLKAKTDEQKDKDKMGADIEWYEFRGGKVVRTR